jgi:Tol biopolymer transport system component
MGNASVLMSGTWTRRAATLAAASAVAVVAIVGGVSAGAPSPELISRAPGQGPAGNGPSLFPSVSADGRLVAFRSEATNLVPDDTDTERDIFVRDRQSGQVTLVSRASGATGVKGNRASFNPRISADGRFVAFRSNANNLVPEDTDELEDIYVRDLQTNQTILVSRASTAVGPKGNGGSFNPSISADGRRVAFRSEATNLSPEDPDAIPDIYVRDLQSNETILVSRASGPTGAKGAGISEFPMISGDGSRVAFRSESPNLHPDDPDVIEDIFLRDLNAGTTELISRAAGAGPKGNARSTFVSLSANGNTVAFDSLSTNLHPDDVDPAADVFARDVSSGALELISRADGAVGAKGDRGSAEPAVSTDGSVIAFHSVATNLDPADPDLELDVFVRDLRTFNTSVLSTAIPNPPYGRSFEPQISGNGKLVAFHSDAGTAGSGNSVPPSDVFAAQVPKAPKCLGKRATALAAAGTLTRGTTGPDVIVGGALAEQVKVGKGRDRVCSGDGEDELVTGGGNDKAKAGGGADLVRSGGGKDNVKAGGAKDRVKAAGGDDKVFGNGARDRLDGGGGDDKCNGGGGRDRLKRCERGKS